MSTATDELVDVDVNLDASVPCAVDDCDNVAAWTLQQHCPALHTYPVCDSCKTQTERAMEQYEDVAALLGGAVVVTCDICPDKPRLIRPWFTWRPL